MTSDFIGTEFPTEKLVKYDFPSPKERGVSAVRSVWRWGGCSVDFIVFVYTTRWLGFNRSMFSLRSRLHAVTVMPNCVLIINVYSSASEVTTEWEALLDICINATVVETARLR